MRSIAVTISRKWISKTFWKWWNLYQKNWKQRWPPEKSCRKKAVLKRKMLKKRKKKWKKKQSSVHRILLDKLTSCRLCSELILACTCTWLISRSSRLCNRLQPCRYWRKMIAMTILEGISSRLLKLRRSTANQLKLRWKRSTLIRPISRSQTSSL